MDQISSNGFLTTHKNPDEIHDNQQQNTTNRDPSIFNSATSLEVVVLAVVFLVLSIVGVSINYKLFDNIRKETHQEQGKVIQRIMKTYAIVQAVGWPCVIWTHLVLMMDHASYGFLHPCIYVYTNHVLIYFASLLRCYVGFNSLIVAIGRYSFIVYGEQVSTFGFEKMRKILICSSFIVPFVLSLLIQGTTTREYNILPNGRLLQSYEHSCYFPNLPNLNATLSHESYKSPIYFFTHSFAPSSVIYGMKVFCLASLSIILSNIIEGILYLHSYIFVIR